jgi:hypothetical protein
MIAGKNPSMLEKLCVIRLGVVLNCLLVSDASSNAMIRPKMVTRRAASFKWVGIVITGVLVGRKFEVISSPAMMLPQASRLIGLITDRLFSLMGAVVVKRGCPMETKKITRRL